MPGHHVKGKHTRGRHTTINPAMEKVLPLLDEFGVRYAAGEVKTGIGSAPSRLKIHVTHEGLEITARGGVSVSHLTVYTRGPQTMLLANQLKQRLAREFASIEINDSTAPSANAEPEERTRGNAGITSPPTNHPHQKRKKGRRQ